MVNVSQPARSSNAYAAYDVHSAGRVVQSADQTARSSYDTLEFIAGIGRTADKAGHSSVKHVNVIHVVPDGENARPVNAELQGNFRKKHPFAGKYVIGYNPLAIPQDLSIVALRTECVCSRQQVRAPETRLPTANRQCHRDRIRG